MAVFGSCDGYPIAHSPFPIQSYPRTEMCRSYSDDRRYGRPRSSPHLTPSRRYKSPWCTSSNSTADGSEGSPAFDHPGVGAGPHADRIIAQKDAWYDFTLLPARRLGLACANFRDTTSFLAGSISRSHSYGKPGARTRRSLVGMRLGHDACL